MTIYPLINSLVYGLYIGIHIIGLELIKSRYISDNFLIKYITQTDVMVVSATAFNCNCDVIFNHVYGHILTVSRTISDDFGYVHSNFFNKSYNL
jgi:hypothetical protein